MVSGALGEGRAPVGDCLRVARPLAAGTVALVDDFTAAPCASALSGALRAAGVGGFVVASRDLAPGELIAAPPARRLALYRPGQTVRLRYAVGAVTIERAVQVVQPAGRDEAVFVRGADGAVFSAAVGTVRP
jgi:flagella basal body P-ring formation protein FlgA